MNLSASDKIIFFYKHVTLRITSLLVHIGWLKCSSNLVFCGICVWKWRKSSLRLSWFILWCQGWGQLDQTTTGAVPHKGFCVWIKSMHVVTVTADSLIWALTTRLFVSLQLVLKLRNNIYGQNLPTKPLGLSIDMNKNIGCSEICLHEAFIYI